MPDTNGPDHDVFFKDVDRDRAIIGQSNMRSGAISQLLSAVWGASGIVAVFILAKPGVQMTGWSAVFGVLSVVFFIVQLLAKSAILWPRGLDNLPHDESLAAYRVRINRIAEEIGQNPGQPTETEYREGYLLQRIRATKERYTRVTLAAVALYLPCAIAFILLLQY
jgi:hypothetical protein